jgi:multicomponent Na+:H+ antiporter subunit C
MTVMLAATAAALFGIGTYLLLQRKLSRIIIGLGRRGDPPLIGESGTETFADPMPQALALTAIVITFGVTSLLLALAYRSWLLTNDDEVQDDLADRDVGVDEVIEEEIADQQQVIDREETP